MNTLDPVVASEANQSHSTNEVRDCFASPGGRAFRLATTGLEALSHFNHRITHKNLT